MGLVLKYLVPTKAGTFHYRRRLPQDVIALIGRREFKKLLGRTEKEALRNFPTVNEECERLIDLARSTKARSTLAKTASDQPLTLLDVHRLAEVRAREIAAQAVEIGGRRVLVGEDAEAASLVRDSYIDRLPIDPETGHPVGGDAVEGRALGILISGGGRTLPRPAPTLEDAKRLYVAERVMGDPNQTARLSRVNRVMAFFPAANVPMSRRLVDLTRGEARDVRDFMLRDRGTQPATVRRYLNDIRAIINHGLLEFDLQHVESPFNSLSVRIENAAINDRKSFPDTLLPKMATVLSAQAGSELLNIWCILENTGCRLGEVTGLMVADIRLADRIPHIDLVPHPHRRLKNAASRRLVPLIGPALVAAKAAVKAAGDSPYLFPRYGRPRGADAASASLMGYVRGLTDDPKVVVHSLRHRIEDKLQLAGVAEYDRNLVVGHTNRGQGDRYGSAAVRLQMAERFLKAALPPRSVEPKPHHPNYPKGHNQ